MSNLPYHGHYAVEFTVGTFLSRNRHRWLVCVRLPQGGFVELAEYRWRFFALRFIKKSWRLAS